MPGRQAEQQVGWHALRAGNEVSESRQASKQPELPLPKLTYRQCVVTAAAAVAAPAAAVPRPHAAALASAAAVAAPAPASLLALLSCQGLAPRTADATCRPAAPLPRHCRQHEAMRCRPLPPPAAAACPLALHAVRAGCGCAAAAAEQGYLCAALHAQHGRASGRGGRGRGAAERHGTHPCGAGQQGSTHRMGHTWDVAVRKPERAKSAY